MRVVLIRIFCFHCPAHASHKLVRTAFTRCRTRISGTLPYLFEPGSISRRLLDAELRVAVRFVQDPAFAFRSQLHVRNSSLARSNKPSRGRPLR